MKNRELLHLRKYRQLVLLGIVVVFHTIGLIGLLGESSEAFRSLSPLNLLLAMACLLLSFRQSTKLYADVLLVSGVGFSVELIGVHTHALFGDYTYGQALGRKLWEVPLIVGLNWSMLSFASLACVLHLRLPDWVKALFSALLMTAMDYLIEPVAMKYDFWNWQNGLIPVYNYVCWFLIAWAVHFFLLKRRTPEQNPVSAGLFVCLIVFFGILNCW
jgi:bisanhydrobacterioruberin hydratase